MNIPVYELDGKKVSEITFNERLEKTHVSIPLLHEVVTAYLANQRSGNASTKTRAEVRGGGAKPWRQKHTGRARAGSNRSPLWRKGGIVFGPKPRSYRQNLPKKKLHIALEMALKSKVLDNDLLVLKQLKIENCKTKTFQQIINKLNLNSKYILVVVKGVDINLKLATRNMNNVKLLSFSELNAYEVLHANKIIITEEAYNLLI